jgi:hypothetical protein
MRHTLAKDTRISWLGGDFDIRKRLTAPVLI